MHFRKGEASLRLSTTVATARRHTKQVQYLDGEVCFIPDVVDVLEVDTRDNNVVEKSTAVFEDHLPCGQFMRMGSRPSQFRAAART